VFAPRLLFSHNPSPMTGAGNNTYLIAENGTALLVDAGVGDRAHLDNLAAELADSHATLQTVIVTHAHTDHIAGVPSIARAHADASFAKFPWPDEDRQYGVDWKGLRDGDVMAAGDEPLTVLHTPGHSIDHISLWHEASGTVFTGDLVVLGSSVMIHTSRGGDLGQYLVSLARLQSLAPRRLLPAHGPAIDEPQTVLAAYVAHRLERERQVIGALAAGHSTVQAIAESIYHDLAPALLPAARENVRAHLDKLEAEGRAVRIADGRWRS
jgi:glyoxylase-like metal-dependent hydrolase (beta-lactamase superfamily II)